VKNGLNIFSFTSGGIPVPLSRIRRPIARFQRSLLRGTEDVLIVTNGTIADAMIGLATSA
jgi:hypothetical protein